MTKRSKKILLWTGAAAATALLGFILYSVSLFGELDEIMYFTPESQPSLIYSDIFILHQNDLLSNSFLRERLADLKINAQETEEGLRFKIKKWDVPESILPIDSPLRITKDATVAIVTKGDHIDSIFVDGEQKDSIALPPTPVARLSGSATSIREYLTIDQIPTKLLEAIIAIEDQRFLEHHGFDPKSLIRAMYINIRSLSLAQGGSTLTQQLVKNLLGTRKKTITRKIKELVLALLVEMKYSKEKILEKYLNEIYFGQIGSLEVHGVSEAARYFYNKQLDKLTLSEIAMIAGVIRGPAYYSPYKNKDRAIERKNTVLKKMQELSIITQNEYNSSIKEQIVFAPPMMGINRAPYFVDYVKAQILDELKDVVNAEDLSSSGFKVYTTIDLPLQKRADEAVSKIVNEMESRYKIARPLRLEGLLISAEYSTGFVRALVGGRNYTETSFNRALNMKRHVGSSFKPIVYLAAFLKGADSNGTPYSPAYMIDDEPWVYEYDKKKWSPKNYEKAYRGHIPLREAFINSINIPMGKIGMDVGIDSIVDLASNLGIQTNLPKIPAVVLGAIELSPMELLQVYTVFANRGERVDLTTVRTVTDATDKILARYHPQSLQIVEPKYIDVLNSLLHSVTTEGTAKILPQLGYTKPSYGKTGTTNFYRDAWFNGFSQGLTTVTWLGFDELKIPDEEDVKAIRKFKSPAQLTGAGAALPIWSNYMKAARPSEEVYEDAKPDGSTTKIIVNKKTGCVAESSDPKEDTFEALFLNGTEPKCNAQNNLQPNARADQAPPTTESSNEIKTEDLRE